MSVLPAETNAKADASQNATDTQKKKKPYYTLKQQKALDIMHESIKSGTNLSYRQILLRAGYKDSVANQGRRVFGKLKAFDVLAAAGVTQVRVAKKFDKLLEAKKIQHCNIYIKKDEDGNDVVQRSDDFIEVDDNAVQLEASKFCAKMLGMDNGETDNTSGMLSKLVINMPDGTRIEAGTATKQSV